MTRCCVMCFYSWGIDQHCPVSAVLSLKLKLVQNHNWTNHKTYNPELYCCSFIGFPEAGVVYTYESFSQQYQVISWPRPLKSNWTNEIVGVSSAEMLEEVKAQSSWCWGRLCSREAAELFHSTAVEEHCSSVWLQLRRRRHVASALCVFISLHRWVYN